MPSVLPLRRSASPDAGSSYTLDGLRLEPLIDLVVVQPHEGPRTSRSGIHLPERLRSDELPNKGPVQARCGTVVAVGPGRPREDAPGLIPMELRVGDVVYYHPLAGNEVDLGTQLLRIMGQGEVIARLHE